MRLSKDIFKNINPNTKFFTGLKTKNILDNIPGNQLTSFLDFEEVKKVNDDLTVERGN